MNFANIFTGAVEKELPTILTLHGLVTNGPTPEQCQEAGWRRVVNVEPVPDGCRVDAWQPVEVDDETCRLEIATMTNLQAEKASRLTPEIAAKAALLRAVLRSHFGDGAETNRDVTATAVTNYFVAKRMQDSLTAKDAADMVLLSSLFAELSEWNGDGTTWTIPWEVIP